MDHKSPAVVLDALIIDSQEKSSGPIHLDGLGSPDEEEPTGDNANRCQIFGAINCPEARCIDPRLRYEGPDQSREIVYVSIGHAVGFLKWSLYRAEIPRCTIRAGDESDTKLNHSTDVCDLDCARSSDREGRHERHERINRVSEVTRRFSWHKDSDLCIRNCRDSNQQRKQGQDRRCGLG